MFLKGEHFLTSRTVRICSQFLVPLERERLERRRASSSHTGIHWTGLREMFCVTPHDRQTAGGDAFLTAQIFLRLLRAARSAGRHTLGSLCAPYASACSEVAGTS